MNGENLLYGFSPGFFSPYIHSPSLIGRKIDGSIARSVDIDLKPGPMKDNAIWNITNDK